MGAWGIKLNQNDVYADVKDFYTALLRYGMTDEDALRYTLNEFDGYANDEEDGVLFWLALSDIMWKVGRLTDFVKENAIKHINSGADLSIWYQSSEDLGDERKKILDALYDQLCSEQPAGKKFGKKRYKKCEWQNGDIFRYQFTGDTAKKYDMLNQYLYIPKIEDFFVPDPDLRVIRSVIGENNQTLGDLYPIIRFWVSPKEDFIPSYQNRNKCIPTIGTKSMHDPRNYLFYILNFPGKSDSFQYIGNAESINPDGENIERLRQNEISPKHLTWKFFEKHVIGRYLFRTKHLDIFRDQ